MEHGNDQIQLVVKQSAYSGRIHAFSIVNKNHVDIKAFFDDAFNLYKREIKRILNQHRMIKARSVFVVEIQKKVVDSGDSQNDNENLNNVDDRKRKGSCVQNFKVHVLLSNELCV